MISRMICMSGMVLAICFSEGCSPELTETDVVKYVIEQQRDMFGDASGADTDYAVNTIERHSWLAVQIFEVSGPFGSHPAMYYVGRRERKELFDVLNPFTGDDVDWNSIINAREVVDTSDVADFMGLFTRIEKSRFRQFILIIDSSDTAVSLRTNFVPFSVRRDDTGWRIRFTSKVISYGGGIQVDSLLVSTITLNQKNGRITVDAHSLQE